MSLRLHNALSRSLEALEPAAPPVVLFQSDFDETGLAGFRFICVRDCLGRVLTYLGYDFRLVKDGEAADLHIGPPGKSPRERGLWVMPGPIGVKEGSLPGLEEIRGAGFDDAVIRWAILMTPYRAPLELTRQCLENARQDLSRLKASAGAYKGRTLPAGNPTAIRGYSSRLRSAVEDDLGLSKALTVIWDALRPGALSPGSQKQMLDLADSLFNVGFIGY